MDKKAFWIHGGPGYNARPEELNLKSKLASIGLDTYFWAHPSALRGSKLDPNWDNYFADLEEKFLEQTQDAPCIVIAHSFGAFCSLPLISKYSDRISKVVWVAGGTSLSQVFRNLYLVIGEDYKAHGNSERYQACLNIHNNSELTMTDYLANMGLILENERFALYYWTNKAAMNDYFSHLQDQWSIDMDWFQAVAQTMPQKTTISNVTTPILSVYGKDEVVVDAKKELIEMQQSFTNATPVIFQNSSHYPHLEESELFIEQVKSFVWQDSEVVSLA